MRVREKTERYTEKVNCGRELEKRKRVVWVKIKRNKRKGSDSQLISVC